MSCSYGRCVDAPPSIKKEASAFFHSPLHCTFSLHCDCARFRFPFRTLKHSRDHLSPHVPRFSAQHFLAPSTIQVSDTSSTTCVPELSHHLICVGSCNVFISANSLLAHSCSLSCFQHRCCLCFPLPFLLLRLHVRSFCEIFKVVWRSFTFVPSGRVCACPCASLVAQIAVTCSSTAVPFVKPYFFNSLLNGLFWLSWLSSCFLELTQKYFDNNC